MVLYSDFQVPSGVRPLHNGTTTHLQKRANHTWALNNAAIRPRTTVRHKLRASRFQNKLENYSSQGNNRFWEKKKSMPISVSLYRSLPTSPLSRHMRTKLHTSAPPQSSTQAPRRCSGAQAASTPRATPHRTHAPVIDRCLLSLAFAYDKFPS